jgi:16S rRNA (cytosine1402-N4)-methyltransferase
MAREALEYLAPQPGQIIVDGTVGAGGHASDIAKRLGSKGRLICIDRDPAMLSIAQRRVAGTSTDWIEASFADLRAILDQLNVECVDAVLLDLGIASDQIDDPQRGFSFSKPGPLDMRMNATVGDSARDLVNTLPAESLADIFYRFGEERHSRRIARAIVAARDLEEIATTDRLAEIVRRSLPRQRSWQRIDPATRVFQALRIAVNNELEELERGLLSLPACLRTSGRAVVISFHSLEDRLVKYSFRRQDLWEPLTRKPLVPGDDEIARNPRSRSAKLRAARRVP